MSAVFIAVTSPTLTQMRTEEEWSRRKHPKPVNRLEVETNVHTRQRDKIEFRKVSCHCRGSTWVRIRLRLFMPPFHQRIRNAGLLHSIILTLGPCLQRDIIFVLKCRVPSEIVPDFLPSPPDCLSQSEARND